MSKIQLYPDQKVALERLFSGAILCGSTGSGKTYVSLFFYISKFKELDLFVITTAKKRDENDWQEAANNLGIKQITVDSWNNIHKYKHVKHAFFVFDEQKVVSYGRWSRTFIHIAKSNKWIIATATPGDVWMDYMPIFIANGFYKNKTHFVEQHVEYNRFVNFPQIKRYHNEGKLIRLRNQLTVIIPEIKRADKRRVYVDVGHDEKLYLRLLKDRWNVFEDLPIKNASELLHALRRVTSMSVDRRWYAKFIISLYPKIIVFYNYNHELDTIKDICEELKVPYRQWNGHVHEPLPVELENWVYITQYSSGAEAWDCIETNAMIFFSPNYSYRTMKQAEGRIDRRNTPFEVLEYYYLYSKNSIDQQVLNAVTRKKNFNIRAWKKENYAKATDEGI